MKEIEFMGMFFVLYIHFILNYQLAMYARKKNDGLFVGLQ